MLILLLACAPHVGAPTSVPPTPTPRTGWFPLGQSELTPWDKRQEYAWRDARVAGPSEAFDAALDRRGRIWVATLEYVEGRFVVRVRVRDGTAWRQLPDLDSLATIDAYADGQIALTTDETDAPVVVWETRAWDGDTATTSAAWAQWVDGAWASEALPPAPGDPDGLLGVIASAGEPRVLRYQRDWLKGDNVVWELVPPVGAWEPHPTSHGLLQRTPSVGGRVEWVVFDPDEGTVLWSGPESVEAPAKSLLRLEVYPEDGAPITAVPRGDPLLVDSPMGWRWLPAHSERDNTVAMGAPNGGALLMEGHPHLVGTHYPNEVNRLQVWRRTVFGWRPITDAPLPTPLMYMERARLLPTPRPTIVMGGRDGVSVVQWNGTDWWGLDGAPTTAGDLGDPQFGASRLEFIGSTLSWRELTEAGHRMRLARWEGGAWRDQATLQPPGSTWLWGGDSGFTHLLLRSRGTWDRVWGRMNEETEPTMFTWSGGQKTDIPMPNPSVGPPCVPTTFVSLPDGAVLAAINATNRGGSQPPRRGKRRACRAPQGDPALRRWEVGFGGHR